jgi:subtilase family serine protease
VGGTTLSVDSLGNVQSETGWSGSGGGISAYEQRPSYQNGFNSNSGRGVPDVSYDADPNTGVSVYDSFGYQGSSGWFIVGGTSAGAPQWASAIADANSGGAALSSQSYGTETKLYSAATGTSYSSNYRDITSGSKGDSLVP